METRRPTPLLFDLDGTLADSVALILASFRHTFAVHVGAVPPDEAWIAGMGTPLVAQIRGFVPDERLVERMVLTYRSHQLEHHDQLLRGFEGVPETLALLHSRGHRMALVTSKGDQLAVRALRHLTLDRYVDVVVGLDSSNRHKPHPEPVHIALARLGSPPPEEVLFVGDSPHDIEAGNAAGVITVGALWGPFPRPALEAARPAYLIADIRELPPLLDTLGFAGPDAHAPTAPASPAPAAPPAPPAPPAAPPPPAS
ncbi:MAG TPA: HAD-IA family hydrolase [Gemmatimonadaceae bacterium]